MKISPKISLMHGGRVVATASVDAKFGRRSFQNVHDDAKYLSDPQFRLFRTPDNNWNIEHVLAAQNETIVDGRPLKGAIVLESGMTIAVGNSAKGIIKFPLSIEIRGQVNLPPEKQEAPTVDLESGIERHSAPEPEVSPDPKRTDRKPINWSGMGASVAKGVRTTAAILGPIFGAVLTGLLSSGSGSGRGGRTVIHRGDSLYGDVILTIDGTQVHDGNSLYSQVLMTIDGNKIRRGNSIYGDVLASVEGQSVKEGDSIFGTSIAMVEGDRVKEGSSLFGTTIARIEGGGRMAGAAAAVFLLRM
jgi:hypothetical protein